MNSPTRNIQSYMGFRSQTAACSHLRALARKGRIKTAPGIARSIVILQP